jgi:hypothetical protein
MAYYEVMSLLLQQAESFQLSTEDFHLEDWIPIEILSLER